MSTGHRIWRIATQGPSWQADDLSGLGAAQDPGRWNSFGVPVVYTSGSIALACLETLVHISGDLSLPLQRWLVEIDIPLEHWQQRTILQPEDCSGWSACPPEPPSCAWGSQWLASRRALLAQVPSVIIPEEANLLINPGHPACNLLQPTVVRRWTYDTRLI